MFKVGDIKKFITARDVFIGIILDIEINTPNNIWATVITSEGALENVYSNTVEVQQVKLTPDVREALAEVGRQYENHKKARAQGATTPFNFPLLKHQLAHLDGQLSKEEFERMMLVRLSKLPRVKVIENDFIGTFVKAKPNKTMLVYELRKVTYPDIPVPEEEQPAYFRLCRASNIIPQTNDRGILTYEEKLSGTTKRCFTQVIQIGVRGGKMNRATVDVVVNLLNNAVCV